MKAATAFGAVGLDAGLSHIRGEGEGVLLGLVVKHTDDDGPVGIALFKLHNNLLADARNMERAPALARHMLHHAHKTGGFLVLVALAVPVELHFDAAMLVGVNLLARGASDHRGLQPRYFRDRRAFRGAIGLGLQLHRKIRLDGRRCFLVALFGVTHRCAALPAFRLQRRLRLALVFGIGFDAQLVARTQHQIFLVEAAARMFLHGKGAARRQPAHIALPARTVVLGGMGFGAHACAHLAFFGRQMVAGIVVILDILETMRALGNRRYRSKVGCRVLKIVVGHRHLAGIHRLGRLPLVNMVLIALVFIFLEVKFQTVGAVLQLHMGRA